MTFKRRARIDAELPIDPDKTPDLPDSATFTISKEILGAGVPMPRKVGRLESAGQDDRAPQEAPGDGQD